MPMAPYTKIDFGSRVSALITVGTALSVGNANIPASTASNSQRTYLFWINKMRVAKALPPLPGLDYSGFTPALNVLVALVP
jgi:hypothetical protein